MQSPIVDTKGYTNLSQPRNIPARQNFFFRYEGMIGHPAQLSILELEKDFLETCLAECVTYLQALRKKQARGARRLDSGLYLPLKEKKKMQQRLRLLEMEIKNRERDEQAFLNTLQACKANIYLAETMFSSSTAVSPTIPEFASNSTVCWYPGEPEPTESCWNDGADMTARFPFQRNPSDASFVNDMAPDNYTGMDEIESVTEKTISRTDGQGKDTPQTNAPKQFMFNPEAAVFKPLAIHKDKDMQSD